MNLFSYAITAFIACCVLTINAKPISSSQALSAMEQQQSQGALNGFAPSLKGSDAKLAFTLSDHKQSPLVYAYNVSGKGFVIAAADDEAFPVLGYVDNQLFNTSDIPVQLREMMEFYGHQINQLRNAKETCTNGIMWQSMLKESRKPIPPMVKTLWNQHAPYNNMCPRLDGKTSVTGCMATAIAQICAYWHWPKKAAGTGTATCGGRKYTWDLSRISFDYSKMTTYYNDRSSKAQKEAVAKLMAACGYAVGMKYSPEGSAASVTVAEMVNHFGYNPDAALLVRANFSEIDWINKIYESLAAGSPVVYWGFGTGGAAGHAFIVDGYQGLGYFHINFGWGGASDGYYRLSALTPRHDSRGNSFNDQQRAVVRLRPNKI